MALSHAREMGQTRHDRGGLAIVIMEKHNARRAATYARLSRIVPQRSSKPYKLRLLLDAVYGRLCLRWWSFALQDHANRNDVHK